MSDKQFVRVEAHPSKHAAPLLAEADREPSHSSHINRPRPAQWLKGSSALVARAIDAFMEQPQSYQTRTGGTAYRKRRVDLRCFMDCVASYPTETSHFRTAPKEDKAELYRWSVLTHEFIQRQFGPHYIAAAFHSDESHPHFHFYIVGHAAHLHPGLREELVDGKRISDNKERRRRHADGLRNFQQAYFEQVSVHFGHKRSQNIRGRRIASRSAFLALQEFNKYLKEQSIPYPEDEIEKLRDHLRQRE